MCPSANLPKEHVLDTNTLFNYVVSVFTHIASSVAVQINSMTFVCIQ